MRSVARRLLPAGAVLLALACQREAPPAPPPPAPSPPTAAPTPAPARPPPELGHPSLCEVEFLGQATWPRGAAGNPFLIIADNDCLGPAPHVIRRSPIQPHGKFFVEIFVPWGSDLTVCAVLEPAPGKPARLYGKAPSAFHAEQGGDILFKDVHIALQAGAPRVFPPEAPRM